MKIHKLKSWREFYAPIARQETNSDVRVNDRDFKKGDQVIFQEYHPYLEEYTGREYRCLIDEVFPGGKYGIDSKYCVFHFSPLGGGKLV